MKAVHFALIFFMLACAPIVVLAQTSEGRISGRVTDPSGAVIAKAQVTVINSETGVKRELQTSSAGEYVAPNLPAGLYEITVAAPSFRTIQRTGVRLEVASNLGIDFQLKAGAASEVVEVTGEATPIDTTTDILGGTINNKLITELPLQGRDFQNLLELRPGIQRTPGGGFHSVTSNGNRFEDNNYIVDGTDDNDVYYGETVINNAGVQGTPASHLPLDAIQEFNTEENQSADYGWKPGAVVNIGLKSGTNQFHGTGYYFTRNSAFDARNWFNPAPQATSDLILHQFGASAGGPIIKDKWFIFGNYEGVRDKVGNPFDVSSPVTSSIGNADLSLPDAIAYCQDPANGCTPNALSMQLKALFLPNPGSTASLDDPSLINYNFNNTNREDNFVIKSDYRLGQKNIITGRYFYANSNQVEEDTAPLRPEWLSTAITHVGVFGVNWNWIPNTHWVNEARFGYNRSWQTNAPVDQHVSPSDYGINTGITDPRLFGFPRVSISPFNYMGGNSSWPLYTIPNHTYQFLDNVSVTHGAHNIRFGGEFRTGASDNFRAQYGRGRVDFSSLEDFIGGNVRRGRVLVGDTSRNVSLTGFGGFAQDDWRIRPNVTLNLGLRYDITLPVNDSRDLLANFIPSQGVIQVGKGIGSLYNTDTNNFSPRVGIAWDLRGNGKTILRAGGAIIFEQPTIRQFVDNGAFNENPSGLPGVTPGNGTMQVTTKFLSTGDINWSQAGPWFNANPAGIACDYDDPCDVFGTPRNLSTPYVASWNFNLQQELTRTTALQIGYVANRGIKLFSHRDINQNIPSLDSLGDELSGRPYVLNCTGGNFSGGGCFQWAGYANYLENMGKSFYNGMQITLTQKTFKGLNFLAGYTWAHALDNGTSNRGAYPQNSYNFDAEWGNGDYDIRNRFTLAMTYELPKFKAPLQMGSGWTFTSIVNLQSGEPFSIVDENDDISLTAEFLDRWDFAGNPEDLRWSKVNQIPFIDPSTFGLDSNGHVVSGNQQCLNASTSQAGRDNLQYYGCYVEGTAVLTPPASGTFGNNRRNDFRGPSFHNWDTSVTKMWNLSERFRLQFRGEFFNIVNHPNFDVGSINTDPSAQVGLGLATATPDVFAANPVVGSGGSRHIQLGVKVIW
jgi:Carboxypeptidase regulatory-like domain/TonB dependent receptor